MSESKLEQQLTSNSHSGHSDHDVVAILDAGAQYGKVIDRRVREMEVETVILPLDTPVAELKKYKAIIISGGPQSVYDVNAPKYDKDLLTVGVPLLGICYGMQLITYALGGKIEKKATREDGVFDINIDRSSRLFQGFDADTTQVLLTHGDSLAELASGFRITATSTNANIAAALENTEGTIFGVQFHPEVDLSKEGGKIFKNFLFNIAQVKPTYSLDTRKADAIREIREIVGPTNKVLVLVSGGVDSSVCALLCQEAVGADRVFALHVDQGFMRADESRKVIEALQPSLPNLKVVDETKRFSEATTTIDGVKTTKLCETTAPEWKRKIIGDTFMHVSEEAIKTWGCLSVEDTFLAQGTLRPDLIESASKHVSGNAEVIKTHHNDTALVRALRDQGRIIEPLKDYHKDEVRALGVQCGLSHDLVWRQPFPGPGLAIRVICATEPHRTDKDKDAVDALQAFASENMSVSLAAVRTVGVQGDGRSYRSLAVLAGASKQKENESEVAVEAKECGAAAVAASAPISSANVDWASLFETARRIPNTVHACNRVVYAFGPRIENQHLDEITPTLLTSDTLDLLRAADKVVNDALHKHNLVRSLAQVPVILFPCSFGVKGGRGITLRPFITNDFMTGVPAVPGHHIPFDVLDQIVTDIAKIDGVARVCYDLTAKPPGTTEWE